MEISKTVFVLSMTETDRLRHRPHGPLTGKFYNMEWARVAHLNYWSFKIWSIKILEF